MSALSPIKILSICRKSHIVINFDVDYRVVVVLIIFEILLTLRSLISDQILYSLNTNNLTKLESDGLEMVKLLPIHQSQNFTSFMIFGSDQLKFSQVFEISMEPCCTKVAICCLLLPEEHEVVVT